MGLLNWLESTSLAEWVRASAYGWSSMLSLHAVGLALIVGVVFALNLRLLGLYRTLPYTSLHGLMGIAWIGIWVNIVSGLAIFTSQAVSYVSSVPFLLKILFIVLGIVNLTYTRRTLQRDAGQWEAAGSAPSIARWLGLSALALWLLALVMGRLIAYL